MGTIYEIQGDLGRAIDAYNIALMKDPGNNIASYKLAGILQKRDGFQFVEANRSFQNTIKSILDKNTIVRPSNISNACLNLLKLEPAIKELIYQNSQGQLNNTFEKIILDLSDLPLLLRFMSICPIANTELELGFTSLRSLILASVLEKSTNIDILKFQSALALQCFTNEYVYNQILTIQIDKKTRNSYKTDLKRLSTRPKCPLMFGKLQIIK